MAWLIANWWKLLMIGAIIYVIAWFIYHYVKANEMKNYLKNDPDKAFETARQYYKTEFYSLEQYKQILQKLADEHNHKGAVIELTKVTDKNDWKYKKIWKTLQKSAI